MVTYLPDRVCLADFYHSMKSHVVSMVNKYLTTGNKLQVSFFSRRVLIHLMLKSHTSVAEVTHVSRMLQVGLQVIFECL
jgi:hypothetical protein